MMFDFAILDRDKKDKIRSHLMDITDHLLIILEEMRK